MQRLFTRTGFVNILKVNNAKTGIEWFPVHIKSTRTRNLSKPSSGGTHFKSGAVMPKPVKNRGGLTKVMTILIPFTLLGGYLSSAGAELLLEYDIFAPEGD